MFNRDIQNTFEHIGLKPNEAKVYLSCLDHPRGVHVQEVAQDTNFSWSSIKLILERLIDRGFVTVHLEENRKVYLAENPSKILYDLQDTAENFKHILPLLITTAGGKFSKVRFFEGEDTIKHVYDDILMTLKFEEGIKKEYLAISSARDIFNREPRYLNRFVQKRVKERIPVRWLASTSDMTVKPFSETPKRYLRSIKLIDEKRYPFHMEIAIYADKIALMSFEGTPAGIIMENEKLASSFRSIFNFFWDSLKEIKNEA